jgi:hypothetical protein
MMTIKRYLFSYVAMLLLAATTWAQPKLEITLKHNSVREQQTQVMLEQLLEQYNLSKWLFTRKVIIEDYAVPHSNPVLTLNTRGDRYALLSRFIHEEIHWYLDQHLKRTEKAQQELRSMYPKVPVGYPEGAENEDSSYLHLIVNYLEYQAMKELVGEAKAKEVFAAKDYYKWIYQTVLTDEERIGRVVKKNKLHI